jgi:hypothetical protein
LTLSEAKNIFNCEFYDSFKKKLVFHSHSEAKKVFESLNNKIILNQKINLIFSKEYPKIVIKSTNNENFVSVIQNIQFVLEKFIEKTISNQFDKKPEFESFISKKFKIECLRNKENQVFCFEKKENKQLIFCGLNENNIENSIKIYNSLKNTDIIEDFWEPESITKIIKDLTEKSDEN